MKTLALFFLMLSSVLFGNVVTQGPIAISGQQNNSVPQIAMDSAGNAIAVWVTGFPIFPNQIRTARFNATTSTWSTPIILDQGTSPQVSIDLSGNAIAVWIATNNQINAARFNATTLTWSTPVQISQPISTAGIGPEVNLFPQVAVSYSAGNAIAVWVNNLPNLVQVLAACFNVTTLSWSSQFILSTDTTFATTPQVSMNLNSSGAAVWLNANTGVIEASNIIIP
ncbi:MAG: hypothetical protein WAM28_04865 [Chlamydiales bacterium]